jgi:acyl dehydratase
MVMAGQSVRMQYEVQAFNTATESTNKIHDDAVARTYGFRGGLVPGVDVYAYLCHLPAARWGTAWLASGSISARFRTPVYDGDRVRIVGEEVGHDVVALTLTDSAGEVCATATAALAGAPVDVTERPAGALPATGDRPDASPASLAAGTVLGPVDAGFHAGKAGEYLADVREELPLYVDARVAHPGWLLRFANTILASNVRLGPWIHVGSDVTFVDVVHDGDHVEARAVVVDEHERKGHRFVVLDVVLTADGRPVQHIRHTAIHTPRAAG